MSRFFRQDAQAIALDGLGLFWRPAPAGEGTPAAGGSGERYRWIWFGLDPPALGEDEVARLFEDPAGFAHFSGVWAFFAVDLAGRRTLCAADRIGIQAVYHRPGSGFASTNAMWLLEATGHDGSYSLEGLEDHLGFGYAIHPERQLYRGVERLGPASYRISHATGARNGTYWTGAAGLGAEPDIANLAAILRDSCQTSDREPYFGLTAGKDSLCLASVARSGRGIGFGDPASDDRIQGGELAAALGWEHRTATLCPPSDFRARVEWIATHSAGLATASYVDMLDSVARTIPPGGAYVMGEAGECVRDFFGGSSEAPIESLTRNYITPVEFLEATLAPEAKPESAYPRRLLARAGLLGGDATRSALTFYRNCRMPGNFAQRNAVLAPLRAKLAPFADSRFIDAAHGLGLGWFRGSRLHREIIAASQARLLEFFDSPRAGGPSPQGWGKRMEGPLRGVVLEILEDSVPAMGPCWDHAGVLAFARLSPLPPRAVYYLLRLTSLAVAARMLKNQGGPNVPEPCML